MNLNRFLWRSMLISSWSWWKPCFLVALARTGVCKYIYLYIYKLARSPSPGRISDFQKKTIAVECSRNSFKPHVVDEACLGACGCHTLLTTRGARPGPWGPVCFSCPSSVSEILFCRYGEEMTDQQDDLPGRRLSRHQKPRHRTYWWWVHQHTRCYIYHSRWNPLPPPSACLAGCNHHLKIREILKK